MTDDDLFWSMVEPEEYPCDCRLWLGDWDKNGYGIWSDPYGVCSVSLCGSAKYPGPKMGKAYQFAFDASPWAPWYAEEISDEESANDPDWFIKRICAPASHYTFHIGHICGLAPCCNPLHLMPITASQNGKDAWVHRRLLKAFEEHEREEIRTSGMDFKEVARTLDIPGGVAFKIIYGKPARENYPVPSPRSDNLRFPKPTVTVTKELPRYYPIIV